MLKCFKRILTIFLFVILVSVVVYVLNETLMAKWMYDVSDPHTETYKGFYEMEKNSIDVLTFGTSHAGIGFNTQVFYDTRNLRVYNLASGCQPLYLSYYWLLEALKYQSPSVVILECYYLFTDWNPPEEYLRKALNHMKWGKVKYDAVKTITGIYPEETVISYFFPFFRFHTRWNSLNEDDFHINIEKPSALKGSWIYNGILSYDDYSPFEEDALGSAMSCFNQSSIDYLEKIVDLCEEKEIKLIIVKTPTTRYSQSKHNTMKDYTEKHNIPFVDFNMKDLYDEIGFIYDSSDMKDDGHVNLRGARKISAYLASFISENHWATGVKDNQWEATKLFNEGLYKDFELVHTEDILSYLEMLKDDRYTVMISIKDEASKILSSEIKEAFMNLGLAMDWQNTCGNSYLAVLDQERVIYEERSNSSMEYKDSFRTGVMRLSMVSAGNRVGNLSSIKINDKEYSKDLSGINIVVYSNDRRVIIDSVNFDISGASYVSRR